MQPIILASASLQRQEYFKLLGLPFRIIPSSIDENMESGIDIREAVKKLAMQKAQKVNDSLLINEQTWVVGADTIISLDGNIFGKPKDRKDAENMIRTFCGRTHEVITGIALLNTVKKVSDCRAIVSEVAFADMSDSEIEWYLDTGEWEGVAGSYRIQGLASCFITNITGSYSSIVGLPIHEFYDMLKTNGYIWQRPKSL